VKVPLEHHWVFWEIDPGELDVDRDRDYIMPRVLEHGGIAQVRWLIDAVGIEEIHRFLRDVGHPEIGERTRHFWRAFFKAETEEWANPSSWRKTSGGPWVV
jgi:hypothetical protein